MKHSKSSLFLMELIIAILFFSLTSTVCIRLFVRSHLISQQTINENHAINLVQNLAEGYLGTEGDLDALQQLFPDSTLSETGTLSLYWDNTWAACSENEASYTAVVSGSGPSQDTGLISADIQLLSIKGQETIYSLHLDHHISERRAQ